MSFAEGISETTTEKVAGPDSSQNSKDTSMTVKFLYTIWDYKYYILATLIIFSVSVLAYNSFIASSQIYLPHLENNTIEELIALDPRFTTSPEASRNFPDNIIVKSFIFSNDDRVNPIGFKDIEDKCYYLLKVANPNPYDELTSVSAAQQAMALVSDGKATVSNLPVDMTTKFEKVAVLPVDTFHYNFYDKVDLVKLIPDPEGPNQDGLTTVTKSCVLLKDNEINWKASSSFTAAK